MGRNYKSMIPLISSLALAPSDSSDSASNLSHGSSDHSFRPINDFMESVHQQSERNIFRARNVARDMIGLNFSRSSCGKSFDRSVRCRSCDDQSLVASRCRCPRRCLDGESRAL